MSDLGSFMSALACFVVELIFFGMIVTLFVMGHFRRTGLGPALPSPSNKQANQVTT
jgi:hypothetical protein